MGEEVGWRLALYAKLTSFSEASYRGSTEGVLAHHSERLRELASWYREYAERTGNPAIWDARIRTAEDLEAEASKLEAVPAFAPLDL